MKWRNEIRRDGMQGRGVERKKENKRVRKKVEKHGEDKTKVDVKEESNKK